MLAAPAQACCQRRHLVPEGRQPGQVPLAIGDSVMLGAASELVRLRIEVDAKEGRVMQAALQIMRRRNGEQTLPETVIIALGTNIPPTTDELAQAIRIAGPERTLVLVTPLRSRQPFAGHPIWRAQRLHPRQVRVADWARAAAAHPDWLYDDGTHLRPAGAAAYARLVRRTSWSVTTA